MFNLKEKSNIEIRKAISALGLKQYEVARIFDIQESKLSRSLRYELTDIEKKEFLEKLKQINDK